VTAEGQLLGDFEVAITGGIWVAAGACDTVRLTIRDCRLLPESLRTV